MIAQSEGYTDLAMEERERFQGTEKEISGVVVEELKEKRADMKVTKVEINTPEAAAVMKKANGNLYYVGSRRIIRRIGSIRSLC